MAETVGLIASVIQVASTGIKLSQTLYQYVDGVATADRRIKDIAKEIELTSFVIDELGSVFKQDETSSVISKNAINTANVTMKECSAVFAEIDATLQKSKKGKIGRLMLPFRDSKIELLRSHIDKLKSTLQLLMQVLTHAYQVASKKLDREAEAKQREEIKQLLENKKKSTKRYEESLKNFSVSDGSTVVDEEQDSDSENDDQNPTTMAATALGSTINSESLGKCVQHIQSLLKNIETLQQVLATRVDGEDHSEHHQNLVGSYFRTRDHLDTVLLGSSKSLNTLTARSSGRSTFTQVTDDSDVGIEKTTIASGPNDIAVSYSTHSEGIDVDTVFPPQEAIMEEKDRTKREADILCAENKEIQKQAEQSHFGHEAMVHNMQSKRRLEFWRALKEEASKKTMDGTMNQITDVTRLQKPPPPAQITSPLPPVPSQASMDELGEDNDDDDPFQYTDPPVAPPAALKSMAQTHAIQYNAARPSADSQSNIQPGRPLGVRLESFDAQGYEAEPQIFPPPPETTPQWASYQHLLFCKSQSARRRPPKDVDEIFEGACKNATNRPKETDEIDQLLREWTTLLG